MVPLNATQMNNVWDLYRTHPTVGCCAQVYRNSLLGEGVRIHAKTDRIGPLDEGSNKVRQLRYEHVANVAMDWLICVGVVPLVLQYDHHIGRLLPIVPQPEAVKLFVRLDANGDRHYEGLLERGNSILSSVVTGALPETEARTIVRVWAGGDHLPTSKGHLITPITKLETNERFVSMIRENVLIAVHRMANPPLVTQPRAKRNADQDGVMWNVDDRTVQDAEFSRLERVANQDEQEANLRQDKWGGVSLPTTRGEMQAFAERIRTHEYYLPSEREYVRTQDSNYPSQFAEIMRGSEEKILQIFGIPTGMFSNTGSHVQSNYMQIFSLNVNIRRMMTQLQKFLQEAWILAEKLTMEQYPASAPGGVTGPPRSLKSPAQNTPGTIRGQETQHGAGDTLLQDTKHVPEDMVPSNISNVGGTKHHMLDPATGDGNPKSKKPKTDKVHRVEKGEKVEKVNEKDRQGDSKEESAAPGPGKDEKQERVDADQRRDGKVYEEELLPDAKLEEVRQQKLDLESKLENEDFDAKADQAHDGQFEEEEEGLPNGGPDDVDVFEDAMTDYKAGKTHDAAHDVPLTLVSTPCLAPEEVTQMIESGVLSRTEGINIQRASLGMPLLTEAQVKKQMEEHEKHMVDLESKLTKARAPPHPPGEKGDKKEGNQDGKKNSNAKPQGGSKDKPGAATGATKSGTSSKPTTQANKPKDTNKKPTENPKIVLEVKTTSG